MNSFDFNSITITSHGPRTEVRTSLRSTVQGITETVSLEVSVQTNSAHTPREIQIQAINRAITLLKMALPE